MRGFMVVAGLILIATNAEAYVGPGLGVGVLGTLIGALVAVFLAVVGVVWYPLKRAFGARRNEPTAAEDGEAPEDDSAHRREAERAQQES